MSVLPSSVASAPPSPRCPRPSEIAGRSSGQAETLVVELGRDHAPALVLVADAVGNRHVHVVVEGLRRGHPPTVWMIDHSKPGDMVGTQIEMPCASGPRDPSARPARCSRPGRRAREDLGPVDDVLLTLTHGPRAQRWRSCRPRLGVADREVQLALRISAERRLLLVGAETHDRRPDGVEVRKGNGAPARRVSSKKMNWSVAGGPAHRTPSATRCRASRPCRSGAPPASRPRRPRRPRPSPPAPRRSGDRLVRRSSARAAAVGALFEEHRGQPASILRSLPVEAALRKTVTRSRLGGPGLPALRAGRRHPPRNGAADRSGRQPATSASGRELAQPPRCERR